MKYLMKIALNTKLMLLIIVFTCVAVTITLISQFYISNLLKSSLGNYQSVNVIKYIGNSRTTIKSFLATTIKAIEERDGNKNISTDDIEIISDNLNGSINDFLGEGPGAGIKINFSELEKKWQEQRQIILGFINEIKDENKSKKDLLKALNDINTGFSPIEEFLDLGLESAEALVKKNYGQAYDFNNQNRVVLIISIVTMVVTIFISFLIITSINNQISAVSKSAHALSTKVFSPVTITAGNDAIGILKEAINTTIQELRNPIGQAEKLVNNLKNISIPIFEINKEYRLTYVNNAAAMLLKKTPAECLGNYCYELFKTINCKTDKCACFKSMKTGEQAEAPNVACPNNRKIPFDHAGTPIKDFETGEIIGSLGSISDQTSVYNLAQQLNKALHTLAQVTSNMKNSSKLLTGNGETLSQIASSASAAIEQITTSINVISDNSEKTSNEISSMSAEAEEMKISTDSVVTSIEQLSCSFKDISNNTISATQVADKATCQSADVSKAMVKLVTESQNIGAFVDVITSIASQTNLLALNATIEAARAGDVGKGFAVVANEVKELSLQTTNSAKDVSSKIDNIQEASTISSNQITGIVSIMKEIQQKNQSVSTAVEEQAAISNEISSAVKEVNKAVDGVARGISSIKNRVSDMNQSVNDVRGGMGDISNGSNNILQTSSELNSNADVIGKQATDLAALHKEFEGLISHFELLGKLE